METNNELLMLTRIVQEQGFICKSSIIKAQDICLDTEWVVILKYILMTPVKIYRYVYTLKKDVFVWEVFVILYV